eukprot:396379-Prorocentrum_minimum.AAC.1
MVMAERGGNCNEPGAWGQLVSTSKLLWNCCRYILHRHPTLSYYFGRLLCSAGTWESTLSARESTLSESTLSVRESILSA